MRAKRLNVEQVGEFGLIERIRRRIGTVRGVKTGIGDDAAVLNIPRTRRAMLFTVDNVVEGVHFEPGTAPELVGRKALARSLSDIAAMGGRPDCALVSLGLTRHMSLETVDRIVEGLLRLAKSCRVNIVGGDITRSPARLFISVAVTGWSSRQGAVLRSTAANGQQIYVTGFLGGSGAGKHLTFKPRIEEAQWLARRRIAGAMIDLSDGLVCDLRHVLEESGKGALLFEEKIPVSPAARRMERRSSARALNRALWDGEDYELLFTSAKPADLWTGSFQRRFGLKATCIGRITGEPGMIRMESGYGQDREITGKGFEHF